MTDDVAQSLLDCILVIINYSTLRTFHLATFKPGSSRFRLHYSVCKPARSVHRPLGGYQWVFNVEEVIQ